MKIYAIADANGTLLHRPSPSRGRAHWTWGGAGIPRFWRNKKICQNKLDTVLASAERDVDDWGRRIAIEESQPPEVVKSTHLPAWRGYLKDAQRRATAHIVSFDLEDARAED